MVIKQVFEVKNFHCTRGYMHEQQDVWDEILHRFPYTIRQNP